MKGCAKIRIEATPKNRELLIKTLENVFGEFQYTGKVVPSDKFPNHEFQIKHSVPEKERPRGF